MPQSFRVLRAILPWLWTLRLWRRVSQSPRPSRSLWPTDASWRLINHCRRECFVEFPLTESGHGAVEVAHPLWPFDWNQLTESGPDTLHALPIWQSKSLAQSWVVDELTGPLMTISMHGTGHKNEPLDDWLREDVVLYKLYKSSQFYEESGLTWLSLRSSTQPTSYRPQMVAFGGNREKRCSRSAMEYFCCLPGVSMLAKKRGMSCRQTKDIQPVASNLALSAWWLPFAAPYESSHSSTASSGTIDLYGRAGAFHALLIRSPTWLTTAFGRMYSGSW
jgi:hypothetical protein